MIKVYKDLEDIPNSLKRVTKEKRTNPYNKKNNKLFKQKDTKEALHKIYKDKCAFCEQKVFIGDGKKDRANTRTVEHYRPKSIYYWLAFSWDNLLLCCKSCNKHKADNFEILGQKAIYNDSFENKIHSSTIEYQNSEKPKMIHPELENIVDKLEFNNGVMTSDDLRVKYTIRTCGLDRNDLNEKRQTIIDDFIESIIDKKLKNESIKDSLKELINDLNKREKEFIALRYWILKNYKSLVEVS